MSIGYISYGEEYFPQGTYYEGDKVHWKDMTVPQRPLSQWIDGVYKVAQWIPNPDRPTYADWQFDDHDADGGYWIGPE